MVRPSLTINVFATRNDESLVDTSSWLDLLNESSLYSSGYHCILYEPLRTEHQQTRWFKLPLQEYFAPEIANCLVLDSVPTHGASYSEQNW